MPDTITFHNTRIVYIKNAVNKYDWGTISESSQLPTYQYTQDTGWHYIPNSQFRDYMTYKDWYHLVTNYSYFCPKSVKVTVQNLIPLTDDLSIAQDTTFMSFNNTIYALTYQDNIYETHPKQGEAPYLFYREGIKYTGQTTSVKQYLPIYLHKLPATQFKALIGFFWDPLVKSKQLGELRPGKNAVSYTWSRNPVDNDKWKFLGRYLSVDPTYDLTDKAFFDEVNTNSIDQVITPGQSYLAYPDNSQTKKKMIVEYDKLWKYPIPNMFIKMIPIHTSKGSLMRHEGQVVLHMEITFDVKHSPGANNMPDLDHHATDYDQVLRQVGSPAFGTFGAAIKFPSTIGLPVYDYALEKTDKAITIPPTTAVTNGDDQES